MKALGFVGFFVLLSGLVLFKHASGRHQYYLSSIVTGLGGGMVTISMLWGAP